MSALRHRYFTRQGQPGRRRPCAFYEYARRDAARTLELGTSGVPLGAFHQQGAVPTVPTTEAGSEAPVPRGLQSTMRPAICLHKNEEASSRLRPARDPRILDSSS